jgi:hypothetical protein
MSLIFSDTSEERDMPTTTPLRVKPDFTTAIARLREIAITSADNALTEGPVNPDRNLLDLCADALHHLAHGEKAYRARDLDYGDNAAEYAAFRLRHAARMAEYNAGVKSAKPLLIRIRKVKATTAAGIYAKAAVVRASKTGAADLAMSLAQDLLDCPGLRAILWPTGGEG